MMVARWVLAGVVGAAASAWGQVSVMSPGGAVKGTIAVDGRGELTYSVEKRGVVEIASSRMGVTVDGVDLGSDAVLGKPVRTAIDETYAVLGVKRTAVNRANVLVVPVVAHGVRWRVEARAYDDGFAWRMAVPREGVPTVTGESSSWVLPAGSKVWFGERNNDWKLKSYAGEWKSIGVEGLETVSKMGPVQGAPLVVETKEGGYLVVTEAALANYSGMRLRAVGGRRVQADFTEGAAGFRVMGDVVTPWRVTMMGDDLNALVNSTLLTNLNPPANPKLFADTSYIRPGRAVWRFWSRQTGTVEQEKEFVDYAAKLGFEYTLVDDGWKDWPTLWDGMAELCAYAKTKHVGVFAWRDYKYLSARDGDWRELREFLDNARRVGLVGVKIDFINGETKEKVDFERAALRMAAERRLMVDFHGIQKPTGEVREFPNAISREGIRGLELNKMAEGPVPASHNAALPFTRYLVGYGDYTPLGYTWPGPTTWAHQLATEVAFTSPFMTVAEDPEVLLKDEATRPALDVLEAIPAVWDETVVLAPSRIGEMAVLAPSRIGEMAVMARRTGGQWFLVVLNGRNEAVDVPEMDLSFLGAKKYEAVILRSPERRAFSREVRTGFGKDGRIGGRLSAGDGLLVWFR